MRVLAHVAAFAIVVLVGYLLITEGYHSFLHHTRSRFTAQAMTFITLGFTTIGMIWATRKIP